MESKWADNVNVTDEEAKAYYDEHPKEFQKAEQVRASHILIKPADDPNTDPNEAKPVAKKKAEDLLKQIKEGADFAALATEHSDCPSSAKGGDLGLFGRGAMVKPFEDAAFAMEPNQVSDLVETKFGYHIIKVTEHNPSSTIPYEEATAGIVEKLTNEKKATIANEYLESLKKKASIVYPTISFPEEEGEPAATPIPAAPGMMTSPPSAPAPEG